MGREIRKVIPNWEHPQRTKYNPFKMRDETGFQPLYNESYKDAMAEWIKEHEQWERGEHPDQQDAGIKATYRYYANWSGNAPDVEYYRPQWTPEEMTWFQVYETVSEGTPVTPPFATKEELIEYLVANGDFWDQSRRKEGRSSVMPCEPWSRKQAEAFVNGPGWAPSLIVTNGHVMTGVEAMASLPANTPL